MAKRLKKTRIERDSMGEVEVPSRALYGATTQRAVLNFPISGRPLPTSVIYAFALLKQASAIATSFPTTWQNTCITDSQMTGFTFPGMMDEPGCTAGSES